MKLTHFGHACLLVELSGTRLLIDPGGFSSGFEELSDLDAVLVTHQHADHLNPELVPALREANPEAVFACDAETAEREGEPWRVLRVGEQLRVGEVLVDVQGGTHAEIHADIPLVDNVALLIGTAERPHALLHPGDSFHVPNSPVYALALPTAAPWLKTGEAVDYLREIHPQVAVPIHEATLADPAMVYGLFERLKPEETTVTVLERGESTDV